MEGVTMIDAIGRSGGVLIGWKDLFFVEEMVKGRYVLTMRVSRSLI
jgi:hypothetical protein